MQAPTRARSDVMNDQDIIAIVVERARRDTGKPWDMAGIMKHVADALGSQRGFTATLCAAVRAAANASNRTPAILAKPGEHWRTDDAPREALQPPRFVPGVDDAFEPNPQVAHRGAAACRAHLGDTDAMTRHRDAELAALTTRIRHLAPTLTASQRHRLQRALDADHQEAP